MRVVKLFYCLLFAALFSAPVLSSAQVIPPVSTATDPGDSSRLVEILPGVRKLELLKINDSTQLQILAGNVRLKQGTSYFNCDSCVINNRTRTFEAWGKVHINDADTANIYASHLRYFIDKKLAYLDGGVRLTDGKGTLTTPDLEYDMTTDIGIYKHGGTVLNKKTVLTSREGYYYAGLHDVIFKQNVELKDPAYNIKTDSLIYNTQSQIARFIAFTIIKDSSGRTIETRDGYYNLQTGKAEFGGRPVIKDGKLTIVADNIAIDDSTGIRHAKGNVVIVDSAQGTTIIAGNVYQDSKRNRMLATSKPLMIIKQDEDSIYITADTLFSARLTDLYGQKDSTLIKDTVTGTKLVDLNKTNKDSTNRYLEAYRHVKIFTDSLQSVGDSLFYSFKDSTFRLFQNPVVWAKEKTQITGDTIYVFTKNKKADHIKVFENSFMVNMIEPGVYNQVKSTRMDGYFSNGDLDSVRARGFAECIYYIQDNDSAYTGVNESKSDLIDIYFVKQELQKVVFRSAVTGTIWPMKQKSPSEMRLPDFQWLEERRPKTKFDLF
ncbi:MAG TPA: OstA-like protein [Chitinophagaceae bacterium]|jgi:lipopolysaccharide export system protein LptA|nr:OstA-like protein [Chitinophagaceae bacterium]